MIDLQTLIGIIARVSFFIRELGNRDMTATHPTLIMKRHAALSQCWDEIIDPTLSTTL